MRHIIIGFNIILMFLFWLVGIVAITPAYNHFIQYGDGKGLPILTQFAIDIRFYAVCLPILWVFISNSIFKITQAKQKEHQIEILMFFILLSLTIGILMILFFGIAGILPYLKIGTAI